MLTTEHIWNEYHKHLTNFIRKRVSTDAVDDILQEVFIKIHNHIDTLRRQDRLESWLFQITRNTIIDHYRASRTDETLPDWISQSQPIEEDIVKKEILACLIPLIDHLPETYKQAIQLAEIERKTQKEVAMIQGISLSAAKSRVQRGREKLRTMLQVYCHFEIDRNSPEVLARSSCNCEPS